MIRVVGVDNYGTPVFVTDFGPEQVPLIGTTVAGILYLQAPEYIPSTEILLEWYYDTSWQLKPPPPYVGAVWDPTTHSYSVDIPQLKDQLVAAVYGLQEEKLQEEYETFSAHSSALTELTAFIALLQKNGELPVGWIGWLDARNTPFYASDPFPDVLDALQQLAGAIALRNYEIRKAARQHFIDIEALTDPGDLLTYDITTGWPA